MQSEKKFMLLEWILFKKRPELFVSVIFKTMKEPEVPQFEDIKNDSLLRLLKYEYVKTHYLG